MNKEVRGILVVTLDCQGPRFKPRLGQKFESIFLLHAHPKNPATGTKSGTCVDP